MNKILAFSLLELIVTLTIVSVLTAIAIPAYSSYITNTKLNNILTTISYYKLPVTDAFANKTLVNKTIINPTELITKLSIKTLDPKPTYIIQAAINTKILNIDTITSKPLLINLIATLQDDFLVWNCQIQTGYNMHTKEPCIYMELNSF